MILCSVIMILLASCDGQSSHCFLCHGIPYEAPCLVDLTTGDVAPLIVNENKDTVSFQILGDARIEQRPGETFATIPTEPQPVNISLFCEDCITLIEATPNGGYILADLSDLNSITLYSTDDENSIIIRNNEISTEADGVFIKIRVITSRLFRALKY